MELGEERLHPGPVPWHALSLGGHGESWAGWPLGKPLECKRTFFLSLLASPLPVFLSSCDVTQQSWDWNPPSVVGITRCSWAVPCALAPVKTNNSENQPGVSEPSITGSSCFSWNGLRIPVLLAGLGWVLPSAE